MFSDDFTKKCNNNNGFNIDNFFVFQDEKYKYNNSFNKAHDANLNAINNNNELTHINDNISVNDFFSTSCLFN